MKQPYIWDNYSDQPYPLQDKNYKQEMRKKQFGSLVKTIFVSLVVLPISLILTPFVKRKHICSNDFFCIGVDFEREPQATLAMVQELGAERVLVRFKLWEMEKLPLLKEFLLFSHGKKITLKILQDREHVQDLALLQRDLQTVFSTLGEVVDMFEIGSTINRAKWGLFSVDEYSSFYKVAYNLKTSKFPHIKLIGSGVIDFEYHFTAHTLFNLCDYRYDGVSSLLYVDRRGAPENMQMGFTLLDKIALLTTMVWLSPKSVHELHITETNWPISGTAPYAPTSEYECVSEELYAAYMLRYHLLAFASQQVDSLSWHQLIAAGYGLVDNRDGLRKREAYEVYKYMVATLKNAEFLRLDIKRGHHTLQCLLQNDELLQIHWSLKPKTIKNEDIFRSFSSNGKKIEDEFLEIGANPIYIFIE
ncbi:MAG: glycosyl hydrolase [Sulfurimonas sp.]|uniref:glycosyl hydrolase n=1 Tax=Sulfurimonas sp. TaxID=2022749 RepID=UPI0026107CF1|nr:glycosyl hydrolase [Sulfurimonas sp.]MDD2653100.1 glycosyl hydrolase [Sulfurimonas sp.]MDD3452477.1 glycosyl hydrolase [Sulfurimonas sp.]